MGKMCVDRWLVRPRSTAYSPPSRRINDRGEALMDSNTALEAAYSADCRSLREEEAPCDGSAGAGVLRVTRRASLIAALLLSFGLWAAIWAAVASLASVLLG